MREQREAWRDLTLEQIYDDDNMFPRLIHNHQTKLFSITGADRPQSYRDEIVGRRGPARAREAEPRAGSI